MEHLNPEEWNQRILAHPDGSFLQSWEWGEFQASLGRPVRRALLGGRVAVQSVRMPLALGATYELASRGPAADDVSASQLAAGLHELGLSAGALFVRCEPPWPVERTGELAVVGFRRTAPVQPETTWMLDLCPTEAELLMAMHPKTRYNIRLAERRGVTVVGAGLEQLPEFWRLVAQTGARRRFRTHGKRYHELFARSFLQNSFGAAPFTRPVAQLSFGMYGGVPVATALAILFGHEATYLYGGSNDAHRAVMASYLLRWEMVRQARSLGCTRYNFWGIAPQRGAMPPAYPWQREQQRAWAGFTRFKQGFGGRAVEYVGAWDLALRPAWYRLYQLARHIRRQASFF